MVGVVGVVGIPEDSGIVQERCQDDCPAPTPSYTYVCQCVKWSPDTLQEALLACSRACS